MNPDQEKHVTYVSDKKNNQIFIYEKKDKNLFSRTKNFFSRSKVPSTSPSPPTAPTTPPPTRPKNEAFSAENLQGLGKEGVNHLARLAEPSVIENADTILKDNLEQANTETGKSTKKYDNLVSEDTHEPISILAYDDKEIKRSKKGAKLEEGQAEYKVKDKQIKLGHATHENLGKTPTNEDGLAHCSIGEGGAAFAVFDGHGGPQTKDFLQKNLLNKVNEKLAALGENPTEDKIYNAITDAFRETNLNWLHSPERLDNTKGAASGSAACVAIIFNNALWVANAGDTRAILVNNQGTTTQLSQDADVSVEKFKKLTTDNGGVIACGRVIDMKYNPDPRATEKWMPGQGIETSQAFGDFTTPGMTETPQITRINLNEIAENSHIVLSSDALWNVGTSNEVGKYITDRSQGGNVTDETELAKGLTCLARNATTPVPESNTFGNPKGDDITVMVLTLKPALGQ